MATPLQGIQRQLLALLRLAAVLNCQACPLGIIIAKIVCITLYRGCAVALLAALAVAPAIAETNAGKVGPKGSALPQTIITQAYMAAVVDQGAVVLHQKGLKSVTSPSTGIFCLTPSDKTLKTKSTFPIVTIEWGDSFGSSLLAYYEYAADDCPHPSSQYEVRTYDFSSGTPTLTTLVAFVIVVD